MRHSFASYLNRLNRLLADVVPDKSDGGARLNTRLPGPEPGSMKIVPTGGHTTALLESDQEGEIAKISWS